MVAKLDFHIAKEDREAFNKVLDRANDMFRRHGTDIKPMTVEMDLAVTHNNCPLDLAALAEATPFDFSHDIVGICQHINRSTGELEDGFLPRYAKQQ